MQKLSLNKAAKEAAIAKSTLLEALNNGRVSAQKNDKGHWQIDPAELFRVFPKTSSIEQEKPIPTTTSEAQETYQNKGLEVEVKLLREQIDRMDTDRDRERDQLSSQIDDLRKQLERQSADHRQALAVLTDQREQKPEEPQKRGFFARLKG